MAIPTVQADWELSEAERARITEQVIKAAHAIAPLVARAGSGKRDQVASLLGMAAGDLNDPEMIDLAAALLIRDEQQRRRDRKGCAVLRLVPPTVSSKAVADAG